MMSGLINHLWQSTLFCAVVWVGGGAGRGGLSDCGQQGGVVG